jgi:hypothetical protein
MRLPLQTSRDIADGDFKVLTMTLSGLLLAAPEDRPLWIEVGASSHESASSF